MSFKQPLQPSIQAGVRHSLHQIIRIPCQPQPSDTTWTSTVRFRFDASTFGKVKNTVIRLLVQESGGSNSVTLAPVPFWFDRIELVSLNSFDGGERILQVFYPEPTWFVNNVLLNGEKITDQYCREINQSNGVDGSASAPWLGQSIPANGSRYFYFSLLRSWFDICKPHFSAQVVGNAFEWRLYLKSPITSGSGTAKLAGVDFIIEKEGLTKQDNEQFQKLIPSVKSTRVLDVIRVTKTSQSITASTQFDNLTLEAANVSHVPFIVFGVRADGYSNTSATALKFLPLGEGATCDLLDPSGMSKISAGARVDCDYLMGQHWMTHFGNSRFAGRNMYCLPLCANVVAAVMGVKNGYYLTSGARDILSITPGAAPTNAVQTISYSIAPTSGSFKLAFRGRTTDELAYNASASTIQTALNGLKTALEYPQGPLVFTVSAALSAGTSITCTTNGLPLNDSDLVQVIPNTLVGSGSAAVISFATANTTQGKTGWTTGTTYTVEAYLFYYKNIKQKEGRIDAELDT